MAVFLVCMTYNDQVDADGTDHTMLAYELCQAENEAEVRKAYPITRSVNLFTPSDLFDIQLPHYLTDVLDFGTELYSVDYRKLIFQDGRWRAYSSSEDNQAKEVDLEPTDFNRLKRNIIKTHLYGIGMDQETLLTNTQKSLLDKHAIFMGSAPGCRVYKLLPPLNPQKLYLVLVRFTGEKS